MACVAAAVVGLLPGSGSISRHAESPPAIITRRRVVATTAFSTLAAGIRPLAAFDNGVEEMQLYANISKNPGTQPALGIRNGKLATCDYAPNCFSTSGGTASESRIQVRRVQQWRHVQSQRTASRWTGCLSWRRAPQAGQWTQTPR